MGNYTDVDKKIQDKDLAKYKKYEKEGVDNEALKPKKQDMNEILEGTLQMPEKLHIVGPIGKTSVRSSKKDEEPSSKGGDGKEFGAK